MDSQRNPTFTVIPFGNVDKQHFTLVVDDDPSSEDYYLFYYRFLDKDGFQTEGISFEFLISIMNFLQTEYKIADCDINLAHVIDALPNKNKEECIDWVNDVLNNLFYGYTPSELKVTHVDEEEPEE